MSSFFIARPLFLLLLAVPLFFWFMKLRRLTSAQKMMSPEIFNYFNRENTRKIRKNLKLFVIPWILGTIALSGPTIVDEDKPVYQNREMWVWVMDLSNSMLADDIKPSRYMQMRYTLLQLLKKATPNKEIALVVFAGNAYTLLPPTSDFVTLRHYISQLEPSQIPMQGTDLTRALFHADRIITNAGVQGNVLILTDGINSQEEALAMAKFINSSPNNFFMDVISTNTGSALRMANGELLKDSDGDIVIARANIRNVETLAKNAPVKIFHGSNEHEIGKIFRFAESLQKAAIKDVYQQYDLGYFLAIPLLLLVFVFRQGFLFSFAVAATLCSLFTPGKVYASDETGSALYNEARYLEAAEEFEDPVWKGNAYYRAGHYQEAAEAYESSGRTQNPEVLYNLANSYAMKGDVNTAILLYQKVQETNNSCSFDAKYNEDLLHRLQQEELSKHHEITNSRVDVVSVKNAEDNRCTKDGGCRSINPEGLIRDRLLKMQLNSDHKKGPAEQW
ncbi:MAG: VWA domain-containing protein [Succinivibrionaceae bacterium]